MTGPSPRRIVLAPALALLLLALLLLVPAGASAAKASCNGVPKAGCLLPFPNDVGLTRKDSSAATGRRVYFTPAEMPANHSGVRINPAEFNRNDGFSPGQPIIVHVGSLRTQADFLRSGIVPITDMARFADAKQKVLLLDEKTGKRQLVWAELDANATTDATRNLLIHADKNLVPGRRYVVVLRGFTKETQPVGLAATWSKAVLAALRKAKVKLNTIYLAWDFTVASDQNITGRLVHMRDDAFKQLGDTNLADGVIQGAPPQFAVTGVTNYSVADDPLIARKVTGTFNVPCYLDQTGCPVGSKLNYASASPDALPAQQPGNVLQATFTCNIPRTAFTAPSHMGLYGHGLLGDQSQIDEINIKNMSAEQNFTFCATNWYGMAKDDIPTAISALQDFSKFGTFVDRQLEGVLAQLYLGRLMAHPQGLVTDPAFAGLIDVSGPLSWDSNSQGAIFGGTTTALAPDWRRAVLGVATMGYSTLLQRSTDFATYQVILDPAYPDHGTQTLMLSMIQMLWDRTDTNGWTQHMTTSPPPNTPTHTILIHVAVGDHQVANVQSDTEARSIGASIYRPTFDPGRTFDKAPNFGIPAIASFPFGGSAVVWWDGGPQTPVAPITNTPNKAGADPHSFPRSTVAARQQKATFLLGGGVIDVCGGKPCHTDNYG